MFYNFWILRILFSSKFFSNKHFDALKIVVKRFVNKYLQSFITVLNRTVVDQTSRRNTRVILKII